MVIFFFSSRRRHTRCSRDWSSDVCSSDLEARDQAGRGRNTSKLLQYLDPTVDFSVGDLFGSREWRETYFGLGVSHRSGIFGMRSEERRVGKECRSRGSPYHLKKKKRVWYR